MADRTIHWYVLFVRTGSEEKVKGLLKNNLDNVSFLPFIPRKTCIFRRQGQKSKFQKVCFPGYVFIESDKSVQEFLAYIYPVIANIRDAYRFLNYGDRLDVAMRENERSVLSQVFGEDHCIDISTGYKVGDGIRIVSGSLIGYESNILRINRNKKEAVIALEIFGNAVEISVKIDIIEKI